MRCLSEDRIFFFLILDGVGEVDDDKMKGINTNSESRSRSRSGQESRLCRP